MHLLHDCETPEKIEGPIAPVWQSGLKAFNNIASTKAFRICISRQLSLKMPLELGV
jgi:hypothetical protein